MKTAKVIKKSPKIKMAMQITSDTDFQKPSFHLKNSVIALRNLIEKNQVHLIYIPHVPN